MWKILTGITLLTSFLSNAQVIPDLMTVDNFRPYLSENQKQEEVKSSLKGGYPRTSEELYPELYKYKKKDEDYLGELNGTNADPANAFTNYTKNNQTNKTSNSYGAILPATSYNPSLSIEQRNLAVIEADLQEYALRNQRSQRLIDDALKANHRPTIKYNLGEHNGKPIEGFEKAYSELHAMLMNKQKIDFVKAVFLVESAYDQSLTWEEFSEMFNFSKMTIERLLVQDNLDPSDNMAKIMSIFKYMADTTEVYFSEREKPVLTKPMLYDYEDYGGKEDATKIFVSKLLRTGTGQCMSLPMLYYLFAKSLGTENVHIALAPQHSFIVFKDRLGNWNNIELTGRMFTTDDFQWQGGFVQANQVKSKIYLNPLSEKETIAYLMTTLALTYIKSFGQDDRTYQMALTAKEYFPSSLTANSIIAGYYKDLSNNILRQYRVHNLTQKDLDNDKNAQAINTLRNEAVEHVYQDLGYAKIPDWHYEAWLSGVKEAAKIQQHLVKRRQLEQQLNR